MHHVRPGGYYYHDFFEPAYAWDIGRLSFLGCVDCKSRNYVKIIMMCNSVRIFFLNGVQLYTCII